MVQNPWTAPVHERQSDGRDYRAYTTILMPKFRRSDQLGTAGALLLCISGHHCTLQLCVQEHFCNDLMFSGHSVLMVTLSPPVL